MNVRNIAIYAIIGSIVLALIIVMQRGVNSQASEQLIHSEVLDAAEQGRVEKMKITGAKIAGITKDGQNFHSHAGGNDLELSAKLAEASVNIEIKNSSSRLSFGNFILLVLTIMIGVFFVMQYRGGPK